MDESKMKLLGEKRVKKELLNKKGDAKKVSQSMLAEGLILGEAIRITPIVWRWINELSGTRDRKILKTMVPDEDILTGYIIGIILIIVKNHYVPAVSKENVLIVDERMVTIRQRTIRSIQKLVFESIRDEDFHIVWKIVENVVSSCDFLSSEEGYMEAKRGVRKVRAYTCSLSKEIMEIIERKANSAFYPLALTEKPIDWSFLKDDSSNSEECVSGGYRTNQYPLIRRDPSRYLKIYRDGFRYSKVGSDIYEAANYIQSVPWRVNEFVLAALKRDLKEPLFEDYVFTEIPESEDFRFDLNLTEIKESDPELFETICEARAPYYQAKALRDAEKREFESAVGKYRSIKSAMSVAEEVKGKDIWFPHNYDFRGRIYPIPIGLNPQGSDEVKALLEFSNGQVLTERGLDWCWAYLATLYGDDKITFKDRVERGKELLDVPYCQADEPYQFLAHQLEIKMHLENPLYPVKTRIHLDACNSGSQFTSGITRDIKGCKATNVIPHPEGDREDAYLQVANAAIESTMGREDDVTILFNDLLLSDGRKICKTPVMVSNYGGTAQGRSEMLFDKLREYKVPLTFLNKKISNRFSKIVGDAIAGVLVGGKKFEEYIHSVNNILTKNGTEKGKSIIWTTPDNFEVYHRHDQVKTKSYYVTLTNGDKTQMRQNIYLDKIKPAKMKSSISPNYIHSLDAYLLRQVALWMRDEGIENSSWIHDSFGCSPNEADLMLDITKKVFLHLIKSNPLQRLHEELMNQATPEQTESMSQVSVPHLGEVSDKMFDQVMISEWFFS